MTVASWCSFMLFILFNSIFCHTIQQCFCDTIKGDVDDTKAPILSNLRKMERKGTDHVDSKPATLPGILNDIPNDTPPPNGVGVGVDKNGHQNNTNPLASIGPTRPFSHASRGDDADPVLTKYEEAHLLGTRAHQIALGAPAFVRLNGESDVLKIAQRELETGRLPLVVRRYFTDGSYRDCGFINRTDDPSKMYWGYLPVVTTMNGLPS